MPQLDLGRSRLICGGLLEWVRGKGAILIVAHDNPDPDSLAAAYALRRLFEVRVGGDPVIAFGGVIGRSENRVMVEALEIDAVPLASLDLDQFGVVCMVDTQPGTGNNSFPAERQVHVVIDHHPLRERTRECRWIDVRDDYGASATILFEYLMGSELYIGTKLATMLFYAIKSETQDLGREWTRADRQAYLALVPLANNRILYDITHPPLAPEYFRLFRAALDSARIYGRLLVFNLGDIDNPDMVAEMADFLLRHQGVEVVLGMARHDALGLISLRTRNPAIKAGLVARQLLAGKGSAGGHGLIAGGQIPGMTGGAETLRELERILTAHLLVLLEDPPEPGRALIAGGFVDSSRNAGV